MNTLSSRFDAIESAVKRIRSYLIQRFGIAELLREGAPRFDAYDPEQLSPKLQPTQEQPEMKRINP